MQSFRIKYKPFPANIRGIIRGITGGEPGGMLTVLIDSTLSETEQRKTLKHELAHIVLNHFELDDRDIKEIEAEADAKAAIMTDAEMEALVRMASA